jgi:Ca2+:H+ antiporter
MSRVSALIVLMIYILYFAHEINSRPNSSEDLEEGAVEIVEAHADPVLPNHSNILSPQPLHPRTIRFADETGSVNQALSQANGTSLSSDRECVDAADTDAQSELSFHRGRNTEHARNPSTGSSSYHPSRRFNRFSRSLSRGSSRGFHSRESSMSGDARRVATLQFLMESRAEMESFVHSDSVANDSRGGKIACVLVLIVSSLLMSLCGEFLVSTIDEVTNGSGALSKPFIGLIILPIVGNIAEYVTVVTVGVRGKLDLAIAVAVGSSIQISLCVTPLTVLAGWALQKNLGLTFSFFEMATLVGSVLLVNLLILNESGSTLRTAGLKGALMCACYAIFRSVRSFTS